MLKNIIILLLIIISILFHLVIKYRKKYELYYNNYKQCLMTLEQFVPELKKYLEKR